MSLYKITSQKLHQRRYAQSSIDNYLGYIAEFESKVGKHHSRLNSSDFQSYIDHYQFTSASQQNVIISALKFAWEKALGKKYFKIDFTRPRKEKKLPKIIDAELLATKIKAIPNLKHKAILALGLSCGLRISEVVNLKWEHLDKEQNILNVVQSKGKKDRICILNDDMILLLKQYWHTYKKIDTHLKKKEYVFVGQNKRAQYSRSSIQGIVKKYITPKASFHLLRHTYATYALDNGTEIKPLSISLGHKSTKTTEIYHHTSKRSLRTIKQAM
ncbi:tyrosine-type recombinase/integrase [Winogradskyella forsetii]|uniref:tyrosine-type recombinase/integrase n=1 Tax=Winogradskyella forsetii TaxID=2686077 RepID=UPI0015BB247B|nr:tyrosine-type recombinase/integrase [Winogradskyella forsetii]